MFQDDVRRAALALKKPAKKAGISVLTTGDPFVIARKIAVFFVHLTAFGLKLLFFAGKKLAGKY